jgi:acyl carrier protein
MEVDMIFEKVAELVAEQLGISKDTVKIESNIVEDLGADSLDVIEMLMTLEEEYGITIPDDKISQIKTVGEIVDLIEEIKK